MTRRDYIRLAAAFRMAYDKARRPPGTPQYENGFRKGIDVAVSCIMAELEKDNPAFSRTRFLDAIYNPHSRKVTHAE